MSEAIRRPSHEQPRGPAEGVSVSEYETGRDRLTTFAKKSYSGITDITELEQHIVGVGKALETVIRSQGQVETVKLPTGETHARRVFRKRREGEGSHDVTELVGLIDDDAIVFMESTVDDKNRTNYAIDIPLDDKLAGKAFEAVKYIDTMEGIDPGLEDVAMENGFPPAEYPKHVDVQQNYAKILHRCVNDVLATSEEPEPFEDAFEADYNMKGDKEE